MFGRMGSEEEFRATVQILIFFRISVCRKFLSFRTVCYTSFSNCDLQPSFPILTGSVPHMTRIRSFTMNNISLNSFDLRLSYLTENDMKQWYTLNRFAWTLWFENTICGPDIEHSRFSVEIFKLYPHYSTWSHAPRQNGGYLLENKSSNPPLIINGDLMNGW